VPICSPPACTDLAQRVRWVSHVDGDGAAYDIRSFDPMAAIG
jgi:hypothetical protein